jgi:iron complex outermembrane recepter protein
MKFVLHVLCPILLLPFALADEEPQVLGVLVVEDFRASILTDHFAGNATVIDRETLAQAGARSLADLLTSQGGIRLTSESGNAADGQVHLRGFGENSSSRVLILVDGRPVNRPDMSSVSLLEVPLSRIQRVEILRGSQTARFGDNAVGGVINIVTNTPGTPKTSMEIAAGSEGYSLIRLAHDVRYSGNGISFDLERNFSDGWRENSASELESSGLRWDRKIADGNELRAGLSWAHQFNGFPGPLSTSQYHQDPRQSIYTQAGQADQYFSEQTTQRAEAGFTIGKRSNLTVDVPFTFSSRDLEWNLGPGSHADNQLQTWTLGPVLRWEQERSAIELGGSARFDQLAIDQFAEIQRENRVGSAQLDRSLFGLFSSAEWEPFTDWHLNAAARWERSQVDAAAQSVSFPADPTLNFSRGNEATHRAFQLGLRWEPQEDLSAWLRYDRLYRLPSTDEIASYQGYPLSVPFNDELKAETGDNFELGAAYESGRWTWRANGFYQQLDGEIAYDYLQNLNVNFAKTRRVGIEMESRYRAEKWEASLRYTQLDATFHNGIYAGNSIYLVPNEELAAILTLKPSRTVTVQAEYQFTGSSYEGNDSLNQAEKLPAYGVTNLLLRYQPKTSTSFYLRVNNLLDESYATVKYSGVWYPAAGRTFQCGIRHEF